MEVTTDFESIFDKYAPSPPDPYLWSLDDLVRKTAALGGFTVQELLSRRKTRPVVTARQVLIFAVRATRPHLTLAELARMVGRTDHSTALHSLRVIESFIEMRDPFVMPYVKVLLPLAAARRKDWTPRYDATYTTISQKGREWWETYNQTAA